MATWLAPTWRRSRSYLDRKSLRRVPAATTPIPSPVWPIEVTVRHTDPSPVGLGIEDIAASSTGCSNGVSAWPMARARTGPVGPVAVKAVSTAGTDVGEE